MRRFWMLFLCVGWLVPITARGKELPRFGIGVNSSLMTARTFQDPEPATGVTPGEVAPSGSSLPATGTGTLSVRYWATPRFAIEPNLGVAMRDTGNGTIAAITVGFRVLYSIALKESFRANVGFDAVLPIVTGGGSGTSIAPAAGPLFGVEYFFDKGKTFSFEVYVGMPVVIPVADAKFRLDIGGNVMGGFHFYLF